MTPTGKGSIPLFRALGVQVYLHWSWFLIAVISIRDRAHEYASLSWNVFEYLALFLLVLMHEYGHALACRQTGGVANQIVLWPLGGVAYVAPPPRPGAVLWSIAAGPLVNLVLLPLLIGGVWWSSVAGWDETWPNFAQFLTNVAYIDGGLLVFNLLPIYPLDGGQILQALLWFPLGRAQSLKVATLIGFVGVLGLGALAVWAHSIWMGIMAAFIFMNCRLGFLHSRRLAEAEAV